MNLKEIRERALNGTGATMEEAGWLIEKAPKEDLYDAAHEITMKCADKVFDTCSIINARSGRCGEDCKWCAQSIHHKTNISVYPMVSGKECLELALHNEKLGIGRYSIVTSGRSLSDADVENLCGIIRDLHKNCGLKICASIGLVSKEQLERLKQAGLERLHCNLETAPSIFGNYCTTHTTEQKLATLKAAQEVGIEICTGGIFGMGETPEQRVEFAFALRRTGTKSVPFNILNPIPGTPLEGAVPMSDDEILSTIAMLRFVMPDVGIRFAGGRSRCSKDLVMKAFYVGVNAAIMGDMLTTAGTDISDEFRFIREAGYSLEKSTSPLAQKNS